MLENLEPKAVWTYFEEICQVPRPSKKEEKIIAFLEDFAKKNNLEYSKDEIGNVVICKPATKGFENKPTVCLQSHMDMVCEKNSDKDFDFENDAIVPVIDGEWVRADETTLGADDGIGMAAQMAVLTDNSLEHPAIECLFTVDEETGLSGAFALKDDFLKSEVLINLDSEDEGELFIGCAGGIDTLANFKYKQKPVPKKHDNAFKVTISGLKGGHSGDDINKGLANSNRVMTRFLLPATEKFGIRLHDFNGGNLRNAIPREATAIFTIRDEHVKQLDSLFETFVAEVKDEYSITEPDCSITIEACDMPEWVINKGTQRRLLRSVYSAPNGVMAMSMSMENMVETSTNLASVKFKEDNTIQVVTSQRSDSKSARNNVAAMIRATFEMAKAEVIHTDGYPGWKPNAESAIMKKTVASYEKLFNTTPIVRSIHAGLECGLISEKYPKMDMISFGPTLRRVHSPEEKINIATVQKFWDLLVDVLKN